MTHMEEVLNRYKKGFNVKLLDREQYEDYREVQKAVGWNALPSEAIAHAIVEQLGKEQSEKLVEKMNELI